MKTAEPKNSSVAPMQKATNPFLSKEGDGIFFGDSIKKQSDFFKPSSALRVSKKGILQTKLTIGQPNDKYEKEADSVADRVVQRLATPETLTRKENGVQTKPLTPSITPMIQTKCAECENEEKLQKKDEDDLQKLSLMDLRRKPIFESNAEPPEDDNTVHRKCSACEQEEKLQKKSGSEELAASPDIESTLMNSKGSGSPLPSTVREQMESSFDADFSNVRIHTSSTAVSMSKDLHAQAFTHGNDIYFNSGKYDTNSASGQHLLAHELTHTVQQQGGPARRKIQRWPDWVSDAADWVSDTASGAVSTVVEGAEAVGGAVVDGARWVGGKVADGAGWVVDQISAAAQWVIDQIRSVINRGTDYLTERWEAIKEFGSSSFETIKNGFGELVHFVTNPLSGLMSALSMMNADLFVGIWDMVKTGANALWGGINSVINGVLQIGRGIWDTVSGFINGIFGTIEGLFNNAAFDLLPDFIKSEARSIFNGLRALWNQVSAFWTDLWQDLTSKIQDILTGIRSFVDNIIGYAIDKVVSMVRGLKEVYDYVMKIFADPEAFIRPILEQIAAKLNAEAPPNAKKFGENLSREAFPGGSSPTTDNGELQMQGEEDDSDRRTATFTEVVTGLWHYIVRAWDQLDILQMLWDTVVNMFWPPATIRAIAAQFSILWNEEWAHTLDSLYTPRNFFDTPLGCLHDIWSNFLILLEFPLALWRTLNYVVGLLMGYITIILVLVFAIAGGVAAAEVGVVPGLIAGAGVGLEIAAGLGELLMASYLTAETLTVEVALVQLFTARQTCVQREKDLLTTVSSLVGMGVALALEFLMSLLADLVTAIVEAIRGIRKAPQPQPIPPEPTPPQPTPPQPTPPQPTPPQPTPPQPTPPQPVPPQPVPPQPVPPQPVPPAPVPPAPVPPAPRPRPRPRPRPQPQPQLQLSPLIGVGQVIPTQLSSSSTAESSADGNDSIVIQRQGLRGLAAGPAIAASATLKQAQTGIDPDRCEADECELPYKWTRNNPTVPGNPVLRYCGKKKNSYVKHGHHSWPKYLGGPENQGRLLPVDENIHLREFHGNSGPIGPIHKTVEAFLNASPDYSNLLQGNPLTTRRTSRGNQLLIERMRTGGGNDAVLRSRVKNVMIGYYLYYRTNSKPPLPIAAYSTGLNNSVNNIV